MEKKTNLNHRLIWVKYLAKYLTIVFAVVICCIPFAVDAYSRINKYALSISTRKLESGVQQLDNDIEKMQMVASMLGEETVFLELQRVKGEIPKEKYLYMADAKERLMEISYIYDFAESIFCLYRDNDIFISNNQVSESLENYYGKFLVCDDLTSSEFKGKLFQAEEDGGYLVSGKFSYYSSTAGRQKELRDAVLYVLPIGTESGWGRQKAALVFVIDEQKYKDLFLEENIQDQAALLVLTRTGQELVGSGADVAVLRQNVENNEFRTEDQKYRVLRTRADQNGLEIIIGFPEESIYEQMEEMQHMFFLYILCGCGAAMIFTIISAYIWYKPFGRMLTEVSELSGKKMEKENAYEYVRNSILKLVSDKNEMEAKMLLVNVEKQAVMLEKIISSGFSDSESKEWFEEMFPWFAEGYQVIRLWIRTSDEGKDTQECLIYVTELFEKAWGKQLVRIYLKDHTAVLLATDEADKNLESVLTQTCGEAEKHYEVQIIAGISEKQKDLEKISVANAQARQIVDVYQELNGSFVERYQKIYDTEIGCFHMEGMRNIYDFVMRGNKKAVKESFAQIRQEMQGQYEKYSMWKYEIYYAINFTLQSVSRQKKLSIELHDCPSAEVQNMTLVQCLEKLEESAFLICNGVESQKKDKNDIQRQKIMEYINANYQRTELTLDIAAKETGLADKYVYAVIKEETGKTFSVYLDELRVSYAKECLETTDWSNEKIANEAGFGAVNSFYRIFKKYTGYSPGFYRRENK